MTGILAYGAYVPWHRLDRGEIGAALGADAGRGTRAVACFDEDTTTMGVAAARTTMATTEARPGTVHLSTTAPAYMEKTNATAVHAALGLDAHVGAYDFGGGMRSGIGALRAGLQAPHPVLAILSDMRDGPAGSLDERRAGDGAAAFLIGGGDRADLLAELLGSASASGEYLDRYRQPDTRLVNHWEESVGARIGGALAEQAASDALKAAGIAAGEVDHLVVSSANSRVARQVAGTLGVDPAAVVDDRSTDIGNAGVAQAGIVLAAALDRSAAGQVIMLVVVADGADALIWRTTPRLEQRRPTPTVDSQIAAGRPGLPYGRFLTWRGLLPSDPPRKAPPRAISATSAHRDEPWKFGFAASRCRRCGTTSLPPQRVCAGCRAVDETDRRPMADVRGQLVAHTIDRFAWSPSPPATFGVIDFDGGGRAELELTEVLPEELRPGMAVEMCFRRVFTVEGRHNYFWKARPLRAQEGR